MSDIAPRLLTFIEWRIMTVLWELKLAKPGGIATNLRLSFGLEVPLRKVRGLLIRLEGLGYVRSGTAPPLGRGRPSMLYAPALTREEALLNQFEGFQETFLVDRECLAGLLR